MATDGSDPPGIREILEARVADLRPWLWPVQPVHDPSPARRAWLVCAYTLRRWLFVDRSKRC